MMIGPKGLKNRIALRDQMCPNGSKEQKSETLKTITYHATGFIRTIQQRKKFIQNHPLKIEVARKIIEARSDKKIITFSSSVKMAETIGVGYVYTGKESKKKKNRTTLKEFDEIKGGSVINTCKLAEEGLSLPDVSVGIMLGINSSKTKAVQTLGRVIRVAPNKQAEFFTIVINNTVEIEWMKKSRPSDNFEIIDEENLYKVLEGKPYNNYNKHINQYSFRY